MEGADVDQSKFHASSEGEEEDAAAKELARNNF